MSDQPKAIVQRLCENWAWLTEREFEELLAPDCVYTDVPMPGRTDIGPAQAHAKLKDLKNDFDIAFEIVSSAAEGDTVIVERIESFHHKQALVEDFKLACVGVFKVRAGKITQWKDYWERSEAEPLMRAMALKARAQKAAQ